MEPKYKMTLEMKKIKNKRVFRIEALRDIPEFKVKKGELGGWIADEKCLNQDDNAWVGGEAVLFTGASIVGNVCVNGNAFVENGIIKCTNNKNIFTVKDGAEIIGSDIFVEEGLVSNNVYINNSRIKTSTLLLYHQSRIEDSNITANSKFVMNKSSKWEKSIYEGVILYVLDTTIVKDCNLLDVNKLELVERCNLKKVVVRSSISNSIHMDISNAKMNDVRFIYDKLIQNDISIKMEYRIELIDITFNNIHSLEINHTIMNYMRFDNITIHLMDSMLSNGKIIADTGSLNGKMTIKSSDIQTKELKIDGDLKVLSSNIDGLKSISIKDTVEVCSLNIINGREIIIINKATVKDCDFKDCDIINLRNTVLLKNSHFKKASAIALFDYSTIENSKFNDSLFMKDLSMAVNWNDIIGKRKVGHMVSGDTSLVG